MTTYFVGSASAGDNDGSSWANRYGSLNDAEDTPLVAGDKVIVGPGSYREMLTCDVSGGSGYSTGTVAVTYGSASIVGTGTSFVGGSVAANDYFHIRYYDNGTDGVTDGASSFTSATGNFQANMIGLPIQINNLGAYTINSIVDATSSITLADPNSLGWPSASTALTYSTMSGEGHHEIDSVDSDTGITLKQPWQGKTLTGLAYLTFTPIVYVADVTGQDTDGIGGVVRITGSDNDTTTTRANCITAGDMDYRVFRGFHFDMTTSAFMTSTFAVDHWVIEDCSGDDSDGSHRFNFTGSPTCMTIRRCFLIGSLADYLIQITGGDDTGLVIENCALMSAYYALRLNAVGGATVKNCLMFKLDAYGCYNSNPTTGQTNFFINNILSYCTTGLRAQTQGSIIEDYNAFWQNTTLRNAVGIGSNSNAYPPLLESPTLYAGTDGLSGQVFLWNALTLSRWSQLAQITGVDERNVDLFGVRRPDTAAKNSWGPTQYTDASRETTEIRSGCVSIKLADAGRAQFWVPASPVSTEVSVYVMRASSYTGSGPQMIVNQPGQAASALIDSAAASQWNVLSQTFTPASAPPYFTVDLVSNNTATCSGFEVYFDDFNAS